MSWKRLSTFALAVLIVANIVFTVLVITEYEKNNYYDQSSIDEMTELLSKSNISLSAGVIPKKRTDMRVYKASVSKRAFEEAVILDIALVGEVEELPAVAEDHKMGRADAGLGHVIDLQPASLVRGRLNARLRVCEHVIEHHQ